MSGPYKEVANAYEEALYSACKLYLTNDLLVKVHPVVGHVIIRPMGAAGSCINKLRRVAETEEQAVSYLQEAHHHAVRVKQKVEEEVTGDETLRQEFIQAVDSFVEEAHKLLTKYETELGG